MEDKAQLESDIVADLLERPRDITGAAGKDEDVWSGESYKVGSLTGKQQEAAIYLGHVRVAQYIKWKTSIRLKGHGGFWVISHALQKATEENPELIVMAARMKKLMAS